MSNSKVAHTQPAAVRRPKSPYPPIADYAFISDCHSMALVGRNGSIDWCCMPRVDSASIFGRLLDWERGGHCLVTPVDSECSSFQSYLEDTLVLETTFRTDGGEARLLDCLAMHSGGKTRPHLRLIRIPREVLEKKAVEQGDIKFFELAALSVALRKKARTVTLELTDFIIPLDDVPEDVQKAVTHWEQWIDYWAVDWNNSDDTFHNEWQSYRTRKDKDLAREISHTYTEPGKYRVVVKVIDILGNDTTKLLQVEVK